MRTRGELRIYLGAAPGVGKTYAMLCEAHRRAERGTDVVVGLVETHGLAEDVGASFHTVVGDPVATALLEFARGVDATQLVLGTSRRSRLARVLVESIGARVVQDSGHIDVHMVTHPEAGRGIRLPHRFSAVPATRRAAGWVLGLLLPLTAVGIGALGRDVLGLSTDVVLFFLATVITALVGGLGPALLAAVASGLLLNFFLTPPLYTFTISERENIITIVAMMLVAVLVALVVDRAARRAQQAAQARPRPPCSRRSPAPCSPAATHYPCCWTRSARRSP
jgi:two-component system, OmpR family, sensor histidine kinase KdpD